MTRRVFVLSALLAMGACAIDNQKAPGLSGPSEFGTSVTVSASPDILSWDGVSQSLIEILVRDPNNQPVRGLTLRVETGVGLTPVDIGTLSARTVSTDSNGRAAVTFTAPPTPPPTHGDDAVVTIIVTPTGGSTADGVPPGNYQNTVPKTVAVRLARPGVILPPNGAPVPAFFFSPGSPREGDEVQFDASASHDDGQIVSYQWTFGDGTAGSGVRPKHVYELAGQYRVVLTVVDDRGNVASTDPTTVTVGSATDPTAAFVISPTDPVAGQPVFVNGTASKAAPGRTIIQHEWDFGDGSEKQFGETESHVYHQAGTYVITLRVTDSTGRMATTSLPVTVK